MEELESLRDEVYRLRAENADLRRRFSRPVSSDIDDDILHYRAEMFMLITDNAQDIIWTTDMNLRFTFVSPAIERTLGYAPEEFLSFSPENILTSSSYARLMELFAGDMAVEVSSEKDPFRSRTIEAELVRKNGEIVSVEIKANFLRDAEGRPSGLLGFTRDMTNMRKVVEEKKILQTQLFEAQKMEAIGTIAGGIAHDFNNILMGIQGHLSLMKAGLNMDHDHYRRLQHIEIQVLSGAHLTRQLLGFAGGGKYEIKHIAINDLIRTSAEMFGRTRKELSLGTLLQDDLWGVKADRNQIEQVLMNLYINAWQAMPEGGDLDIATANVALPEREARANGVKAGRYVRISVKDSGVGMDHETRRRIFEPFFTTKETGQGAGLGLASVYGIVRNHGGFVTVQSEPGRGSTFHLFLPASDEETVAARSGAGEGTGEEILSGQETILLVDDEEMVVSVTMELLEYLGYRVMTAGSGQEALAVFMEKGKEIDLIILDRIMPGMGGKKTFDAVRAIDPQVKVVMSSGYSADKEIQKLLAQGCSGFLQKPYRMQELSQKLRDVLGNESGASTP